MANYAQELPRDRQGMAMTGQVAAYPAVTRYIGENATASSVLTLSSVTTAIEIAAVGAAAIMRWVNTADTQASVVSAASGSNYDHVIPTGTFRRFVVPIEVMGPGNSSGEVGINIAQGLYKRVAIKSAATASVLTTEY